MDSPYPSESRDEESNNPNLPNVAAYLEIEEVMYLKKNGAT